MVDEKQGLTGLPPAFEILAGVSDRLQLRSLTTLAREKGQRVYARLSSHKYLYADII